MEEAKFKYFIDGEEVDGNLINWEYTTSIISKGTDIHVGCHRQDYDKVLGFRYPEEDKAGCVFKGIFGGILLNGLMAGEDLRIPMESPGVAAEPTNVGIKHNKLKAPLDIVQTRQFPKALQALALATAFGNKKYKDTDKDFLNFKRVEGGAQTYFDAAARHNVNRFEIDKTSGLLHLIHAVWNMLAALEITIEENEVDMEIASEEYLKDLHSSN